MGEDKSLLPFISSSSLIEFQYQRLKPYFTNTYISSKSNKFDFSYNFLSESNLILDENQEIYSPILALYSIFRKLPNQKIFIITVDTPFVTINSIKELIANSKGFDITIAQTQKSHNLCGIFSSNIVFQVEEMIEKDIHKVNYLVKNSNHNIVKFFDNNEFININDKNDYEKALTFIKKYYN